jgi:hypothetical protein
MIVLATMALLAAIVAVIGIVIGSLALLIRGVLWLVLLPFRLLFGLAIVPFILGGIALTVLVVVGFAVFGALFVTAGVLLAAAISLLLPVALVAGVIWLIAKLAHRGRDEVVVTSSI